MSPYGKRAPRRPKKKRGECHPKSEHAQSPLRAITRPTKSGKLALHPDLKAKNFSWEDQRWLEEQRSKFKRSRGGEHPIAEHLETERFHQELQHFSTAPERLARKRLEKQFDREIRDFFLDKRMHNQYMRTLFRKPVNFRTQDGKRVRILSFGLKNIFQQRDSKRHPPRAMVGVFVNGRYVFFYQSSGQSSKRPGMWIPTGGPLFEEHEPLNNRIQHRGTALRYLTVERAGYLNKFRGHPSRGNEPRFPKWVMEVSERIAKEVSAGRVKLNPVESPKDVRRFHIALDFFPHLWTHVSSNEATLPE